ncbi:hypothetical protein [Kibdelosporangium persicum]|nr:hypothetical protein [Kibdelosporangium persicum]
MLDLAPRLGYDSLWTWERPMRLAASTKSMSWYPPGEREWSTWPFE